MRFVYADPPYPGQAELYRGHPDYAGEVDHAELVEQLVHGGFDGWALSTSADALGDVLSLCAGETRRVRVAAWFRGARPHGSPLGPLSSWEPVIYAGGRAGTSRPDSLVYHARPRLTDPRRVIGAKPATFARWLFELLGATAGDELVDLFPGSGGIGRAWETFTGGGQLTLPVGVDSSSSTRTTVDDHVGEPVRDRDPVLECIVCGEPIDEACDVEPHWPDVWDGEIPVHHWCCPEAGCQGDVETARRLDLAAFYRVDPLTAAAEHAERTGEVGSFT